MINENIAALRKQRGMTQENLAKALGVTNQAVSKWESSQCCPDIALIPEIADHLGVTVDELFGRTLSISDIKSELQRVLEALPTDEADALSMELVSMIHIERISHEMSKNPGWDKNSAIEHSMNGEWGISRIYSDNFSTGMHGGSVFFSNNKLQFLNEDRFNAVLDLLNRLSDRDTLTIFGSIFSLTAHSESRYARLSEIAENSNIPLEKVSEKLNFISKYLSYKDNDVRICGMYMHVLPLISLLTIV